MTIAGTYKVIKRLPHDRSSFTQGLIYSPARSVLYESSGLYGKSEIREVEASTGEILKRRGLNGRYFAEGIFLGNDGIEMLTWKERVGFVFDEEDCEFARFHFRFFACASFLIIINIYFIIIFNIIISQCSI